MFKKSLLVAATILSAFTVNANEFYTVLGAGYSETDSDNASLDGTSYKLGFGYELDRQWYVEAGFQQLLDEKALPPTTNSQFENGFDAQGFYVAFLGKASAQNGELFYRVGVMTVDVEEVSYFDGSQSCAQGLGSEFTVATQTYTRCTYDDSMIAGVFGLGFDFRMGKNIMIRTEVEHLRGEDDIEINAAYIGVRYNF